MIRALLGLLPLTLVLLVLPMFGGADRPGDVALQPDVPGEPAPRTRVVRLTVRVEGNGGDAYVELPLAQSDEHQTIADEKLLGRGFQVEEVTRDGNRLAVLTFPGLEGPRRITYQFTATTRNTALEVPATPVAVGEPAEDERVWLRPTRNLQASSPIVREKLIAFARPRMAAGETDAIRLAWDLTKAGYERKRDGSRTVLKATRTGHASDKGLDRLFATFLRTSGVPSRPVIGVDIGKRKGSRAATWVEAKAGGTWVPMSVPRGQWGKLPDRYVKLAHGDRPFIVKDGVASLRYRWKVTQPAATATEVKP
ncbi:MAG TPA: transglutaminase domain-containing protein [Vulgatibacter sp.]